MHGLQEKDIIKIPLSYIHFVGYLLMQSYAISHERRWSCTVS